MDWIDLIERFNTWGKYPFATLIHWIVGFFCGLEVEAGRLHKNVSQSMTGIVVIGMWICYEISEYWTEHDHPDVDIANGIGGVALGIVAVRIAHVIITMRKGE